MASVVQPSTQVDAIPGYLPARLVNVLGNAVLELLKEKTMSEWVEVGTLPVDAGCIMLVDPCYVRDTNESWYDSQVVDRCHENGGRYHGVNGSHSLGDLGIIVESGYGDGCYPAYVKYDDNGRVSEVKVVFVADEKDDKQICIDCGMICDYDFCDCAEDCHPL